MTSLIQKNVCEIKYQNCILFNVIVLFASVVSVHLLSSAFSVVFGFAVSLLCALSALSSWCLLYPRVCVSAVSLLSSVYLNFVLSSVSAFSRCLHCLCVMCLCFERIAQVLHMCAYV